MKKTVFSLISIGLLLLTSCSDTDSSGFIYPEGEVPVNFVASVNPVRIEHTRSINPETKLPLTALCGEQVGIYGIRATTDNVDTLQWKHADADVFQHPLYNAPYCVMSDNRLQADDFVAYYPMGGEPALATYAYWPYHPEATLKVERGAVIPVDLTKQQDLLYTGKVTSICHAGIDNGMVSLPFKHALGALSFKFYSEGDYTMVFWNLHKIEVITSHTLRKAEMTVADGSFTYESGKSDTLSLPLNGYIVMDEAEADTTGTVLLFPHSDITEIRLTLQTGPEKYAVHSIYQKEDELFEIEAGHLTVLSFNCSRAETYTRAIEDTAVMALSQKGLKDEDLIIRLENIE